MTGGQADQVRAAVNIARGDSGTYALAERTRLPGLRLPKVPGVVSAAAVRIRLTGAPIAAAETLSAAEEAERMRDTADARCCGDGFIGCGCFCRAVVLPMPAATTSV